MAVICNHVCASSASMWVCCQSNLPKFFRFKKIVNGIRSHWRYTKSPNNVSANIKYLLVIDFEATCEETNKITQEIIEFPCLKLNTSTFSVDCVFHEYVKPVVHPELPTFCVELTGILQEMVDAADPFSQVLNRFEKWRDVNNLTEANSIIVTSGDWDLGKMFPSQCTLSGVKLQPYYLSWIDLKKLYGRETGNIPKSLIEMIQKCGLTFKGRQHSGIDDCINIANILRYIGKNKSIDLRPTSTLRKTSNGFKVLQYPS